MYEKLAVTWKIVSIFQQLSVVFKDLWVILSEKGQNMERYLVKSCFVFVLWFWAIKESVDREREWVQF